MLRVSQSSPRFFSHPVLPPVAGFDIIGDVHGCAVTLERLLQKLNYRKKNHVYEHPTRRVIFLGDVIDRGPRIREAALIAYDMVQRGSAQMILGNHEFNAMLYSKKNDCTGQYLRAHTPGHSRQIKETLQQFSAHAREWAELLRWFATLPLFLQVVDENSHTVFRCVHACWDQPLIDYHLAHFPDGCFDESFIRASAEPPAIEFNVRQRLLAGVDIPLPDGMRLLSADGYERDRFRAKFWTRDAKTYGELLFQPDPLPDIMSAAPVSAADQGYLVDYDAQQPPLFVGHYWLKGKPKPIAPNIACLDYSAVRYGRLVAYRMDGEQQLSTEKFAWEYVDP